MVKSSPLALNASVALKSCSSPLSLVSSKMVSTPPLTTPSWSAMLISARTCTVTPCCLEVPPCSPVLLSAWPRKSLHWLLNPWRSRSLPHQSASTLSGSEVPSCPLFPLSNKCGSPRTNTTSLVPQLSTASASKPVWMFVEQSVWVGDGGIDDDDVDVDGDWFDFALSSTRWMWSCIWLSSGASLFPSCCDAWLLLVSFVFSLFSLYCLSNLGLFDIFPILIFILFPIPKL